jgi:hypothetical protein
LQTLVWHTLTNLTADQEGQLLAAGPAVAGAGEYLMMLPQLLEGALEAAEVEPGDGGLDGDWLDKVWAVALNALLQHTSACSGV